MILVNTDYITGKELEMLGLVKGARSSLKTSVKISPKVLKLWLAVNLAPIRK